MKNKFVPYNDKISIRPIKVESLLNNDNLQEKGEVLAVGKDCKFVKVGDIVFFQNYGFLETAEDSEGSKYFLVPERPEFILGKIQNVRGKK